MSDIAKVKQKIDAELSPWNNCQSISSSTKSTRSFDSLQCGIDKIIEEKKKLKEDGVETGKRLKDQSIKFCISEINSGKISSANEVFNNNINNDTLIASIVEKAFNYLGDYDTNESSLKLEKFEYIAKFVRGLTTFEQTIIGLTSLYHELKSKNPSDNHQFMMLFYLTKEHMNMAAYNKNRPYNEKFEFLLEELKEKNEKGIDEWGPKIKARDYQQLISWGKKFKTYESSFALAVPDLVKAAYSESSVTFKNFFDFFNRKISQGEMINNSPNFENVTKFIRDFQTIEQSIIGYSALYDEMKSNNHLQNLHLTMLFYLVKEETEMPNYPAINQKYKDQCETLRENLLESSKKGIDEWGFKIRARDYQQLISWGKTFNIYEGSFSIALPDIVKAAYLKNSQNFENVTKFIRDLYSIDQNIIGYSTLYEEMKSNNQLQNYQVTMLFYLLEETIEFPNYPNIKQKYKDQCETLRENLLEGSKKGIDEWGPKIRALDYQQLISWGKTFNTYQSSFALAVPDLVKAAYLKNSQNFENVTKFIRDFSGFDQIIIGYSALYEEMKSNNHLQNLQLTMLFYLVQETIEMKNYPAIKQKYKDQCETLRGNLLESSKRGIAECGAMIRNGNYEKINSWSKSTINGNSFAIALPDIVKAAYSRNSNNFEKVSNFIRNIPYISQGAIGYSALYEEMKSNGHISQSRKSVLASKVKEFMNMPNYPNTSEKYKTMFENLKVKLTT